MESVHRPAAEQRALAPPPRRRMPTERRSLTHKFCVDGHEGYLTAGLYDDGTVGELFITDFGKEGSTLRGVFSAWATTLSIALQHGVPLESLVRKFAYMRFEPHGATDNPEIPKAHSIPRLRRPLARLAVPRRRHARRTSSACSRPRSSSAGPPRSTREPRRGPRRCARSPTRDPHVLSAAPASWSAPGPARPARRAATTRGAARGAAAPEHEERVPARALHRLGAGARNAPADALSDGRGTPRTSRP
jgi:hypothetical protein